MNPKNHGVCCDYLSKIHKITLAEAVQMLKAMPHKTQYQTLDKANKAKAEPRTKAKRPTIQKLSNQPAKPAMPLKKEEPFAKPIPSSRPIDASTENKLYSLLIPLDDLERLKKAAKDGGQSVSSVIRAAIKNHLIHYM